MTAKGYLLSLICGYLAACAASPPRRLDDTAAREQLRCAAMEAALNSIVPRGGDERLALRDSTFVPGPRPSDWLRGVAVDPSTIRDFDTMNVSKRASCAVLPSGADLILVSDSAWTSLPQDLRDRWPAFYEAFPRTKGLMSVSGIGVSDDGQEALMLIDHGCGTLCGSGHVVLVRRSAEGWKVAYSRMAWVS